MDFVCVQECSNCCIEREYYPSIKFGKVGVFILPEEKQQLELLAKQNNVTINILPRIGISSKNNSKPDIILAYQMMGKDPDGNTCPFLDVKSGKTSPHGGFPCIIYKDRPLACRAYPIIGDSPIEIDSKCKFCKTCGTPTGNVDGELESLLYIKNKMNVDISDIWRYATGIGESQDKGIIQKGWFLD